MSVTATLKAAASEAAPSVQGGSLQGWQAKSAHEDIASLAYALWQQRGCPEGSPEEDWFKAEQELSGPLQA